MTRSSTATIPPFLPRAVLVACALAPVGGAFAHGYVEGSRNKFCAEGRNGSCGAVRYEPQSVEGPDRYPGSGPADGTLAAAGSAAWAPLNVQSATRWTKLPITAGDNTFHWHFTANHVSGDFRYFITRPDWDPDAPLARGQFESEPFCTYDGGFVRPEVDTFHACDVPDRSGYQVILAIWDVGDTDQSFYNALDVDFSGGGSEFDDTPPATDPDPGTPPVVDPGDGDALADVGDVAPSMDLAAGDVVRLRLFATSGELAGRAFDYTVADDATGAANDWTRAFAQFVNDGAREVEVGVRTPAGAIEPRRGANDVYARPSSGIVRTEVEFVIADGDSGTPGGGGGTDDGGNSTDEAARRYPDGLGSYVAGERVDGRDGGSYVCKIAGWCNVAPSYYEPGTGLAWADAWERVASGGDAPAPAGAELVYPAGRGEYAAGTVVTGTDGAGYRCLIPGWCNSASEFYYAPGTGLAFEQAWTRQ